MKHQPFYRTIRTAGIFLLCLMMMNIANAQFGSVNVKKLKEEQRAKKVEKSKASTDIKALESAISELKRLNGNSDKDLAGKNYESYAQNQKAATEHLANIKKKDPKWKIATYETSLQTFSRRLTKIGPLHKLEGKKEELRTFIKKKDRISAFSNCDSQLEKVKEADASTVDCGQKFYNYYVERVEADVLHKKMVELKKIDPKYMESVNSYMRRDYLEGYTSWLEGILAQANDFSNNTLKKTDFHKLTSQTKLVISYLKWKVKTVEKLAPEMATACTKTNLNLKKARAHVHEFRLKESMISPENIGKIIFTKTDVGRKEFASVQKLTSWNLAKPLNYRFFMNQTPQEFHAEVNTDGRMSPEKAVIVEKIYLDGDLFMNDYSIKTFYDSQDLYLNAMTMRNIEEDALYRNLVMKISKMGYGTYQLKIEMYMREKDGSKLSSRMATG
ncbi:MAG TPA: hypothetical protein ENJ82_00560, partial [Bacteroidetes bacterium]|nr:hypothetical protein [Bacteroidota bacterium]